MESKMFVDNLCIYWGEFKETAASFVEESNSSGGTSSMHEIKTLDDIETAFNTYFQVKFFEVLLHGDAGVISLPGKCGFMGNYFATLCENPMFLQKNARILFDSCSIGAGETGDKFMDSIGAGFLKGKGGFVGATTVQNWAYPFGVYMRPLSFGRVKVKKYDEAGTPVAAQTVDRHGIKR